MTKMPIRWAEPEPRKNSLKPWLLAALTLAVLAFCSVLFVR